MKLTYTHKMIISAIIDLIDLVFGIADKALPVAGQVIGTVWDIIQGIIAVALWGPAGFLAFLEVIEITNSLDSFIPTLTLIGLSKKVRESQKPTLRQCEAKYPDNKQKQMECLR